MKISDLFEGKVKQAAMDGTYSSTPSKTKSKQYTFLFYTFNQYYHGTTSGVSMDKARANLLGRLRRFLGKHGMDLTKENTSPKQIGPSDVIPRSSKEIP